MISVSSRKLVSWLLICSLLPSGGFSEAPRKGGIRHFTTPVDYEFRAAERYRNPTPIKKLTEEQKARARELAQFEMHKAKESAGNWARVFEALTVKADINKSGLEGAHNRYDYGLGKCVFGKFNFAERDSLTGRSYDRATGCESTTLPFSQAQTNGQIARSLSNAPFTSRDGVDSSLKMLIGLASSIPTYGKPASMTGAAGVHSYEHWNAGAEQRALKNLSGYNKNFELHDTKTWELAVENRLTGLFENGMQSDSVGKVIEMQLGTGILSFTRTDMRRARPTFQLSDRVSESEKLASLHGERLDDLETRFRELETGLNSIPSFATAFWNSQSLSRMSPEFVRKLGSLPSDDNADAFTLNPSERDSKYSILGPSETGVNYDKYDLRGQSLVADENNIEDLEKADIILQGIQQLAPDKKVRDAAAVASAGIKIGIAAASLTGVGLATAIAGIVSNLMSSLFGGGGKSVDDEILEQVNALHLKIDRLAADTANGLKDVRVDLKDFRRLVEDEFAKVHAQNAQDRDERRESSLYNEMMAKAIHRQQFVEAAERLAGNQRQRRDQHLNFFNLSAMREVDGVPTDFHVSKFIERISPIETSALISSSDIIDAGDVMTPEGWLHRMSLDERDFGKQLESSMTFLSEHLLSKYGLDIRPETPASFGDPEMRALLEEAQSPSGSEKRGQRQRAPSLHAFLSEAKLLKRAYEREKMDSSPRAKVHQHLLEKSDRNRVRLGVLLDSAVKLRQARLDIVPQAGKDRVDLRRIAPIFDAYDAELDAALLDIKNKLRGKLHSSPTLKGYNPSLPLSQQFVPADRLKSHEILGPQPSTDISACSEYKPKSKDGVDLRLPMAMSQEELLNATMALVPSDLLVARDLLGGYFSICYESVDVSQRSILPVQHSDSERWVEGEISGRLGIRLKVRYHANDGKRYDVRTIALAGNRNYKFFNQKFYPVWENLPAPVDVSPTDVMLEVPADARGSHLESILNWEKDQSTLGRRLGFMPSYELGKSEEWDKRIANLQAEWPTIKNGFLQDLGKHAPQTFDEIPKEGILSADQRTRKQLVGDAKDELLKNAKDLLLVWQASIEQGTGPLLKALEPLETRRLELLSALYLAFGPDALEREEFRELKKLPDSRSVLALVTIDSPLLKEGAEKITSSMHVPSKSLYAALSKRGHLIPRGDRELDELIRELADTYIEGVRSRPDAVASMTQVPESLGIRDFEHFQKIAARKVDYKFELPPVTSTGEQASERHELEEALLAAKNSPRSVLELHALREVVRKHRSAATSSTSAAERVADNAHWLMYAPSGPRLSLDETKDLLMRMRDLPTEEERKLWTSVKELESLDEKLTSPTTRQEIAEALSLRKPAQDDRKADLTKAQSRVKADVSLRQKMLDEMSNWEQNWQNGMRRYYSTTNGVGNEGTIVAVLDNYRNQANKFGGNTPELGVIDNLRKKMELIYLFANDRVRIMNEVKNGYTNSAGEEIPGMAKLSNDDLAAYYKKRVADDQYVVYYVDYLDLDGAWKKSGYAGKSDRMIYEMESSFHYADIQLKRLQAKAAADAADRRITFRDK